MTAAQPSIRPVPAGQLTQQQIERWSDLQKAEPRYFSPFFRPEFTLAAAQVYADVEVAVFEQDGQAVGFFPFQRIRGKQAVPVGGLMSQYQAAIMSPGTSFSPKALLEACGLVSWNFNHLLADQSEFQPFHTVTDGSPYLDLSQGFEAYVEERRKAGKKDFFKQVRRKTRQLDREMGPLRLERSTKDINILNTLIQWKSDQYKRNRTFNFMEAPGIRPLLETVFGAHSPDFLGKVSALYAGDRLIALEMGIRSGRFLHAWISVYDPTLPTKYSPGHTLSLMIAEAAPGWGVERIDIGKGLEPYKRFWTSGTTELAEGAIDTRPLPRLLNATWIRTRDWIRSSPLKEPARRCKQAVQPMYERIVYRSARSMSLHR